MIDAEGFKKALEKRGLVILGVSRHRRLHDCLTVYLHGAEGQWAGGYALEVIRGVAGVLRAEESMTSPTIINVRMQRTL